MRLATPDNVIKRFAAVRPSRYPGASPRTTKFHKRTTLGTLLLAKSQFQEVAGRYATVPGETNRADFAVKPLPSAPTSA
jgi:hypothetical protein